MKRMMVPLAIAVATFLTAANAVADDTTTPVVDETATAVCPAFVDADGDGINDNARQGGRNGRGMKGGRGVFVDENGDGINDNAPDADGDGIPNGQDPDFVRQSKGGRGFVDADGDGINDLAQDSDGDGVINCLDADYEGPVATAQGQMQGRRGGRGQRAR